MSQQRIVSRDFNVPLGATIGSVQSTEAELRPIFPPRLSATVAAQ